MIKKIFKNIVAYWPKKEQNKTDKETSKRDGKRDAWTTKPSAEPLKNLWDASAHEIRNRIQKLFYSS